MRFRPEFLNDIEGLEDALEDLDADLAVVCANADESEANPFFGIGNAYFDVMVREAGQLSTLLQAMLNVEDGHRMLQTLDLASNFTGDEVSDMLGRTMRVLLVEDEIPTPLAMAYVEVAGVKEIGSTLEEISALVHTGAESDIIDTSLLLLHRDMFEDLVMSSIKTSSTARMMF